MNAIYQMGIARGAKNIRAGVYDHSMADYQARQSAAVAYLRRKGIVDWSFDRHYEMMAVKRAVS